MNWKIRFAGWLVVTATWLGVAFLAAQSQTGGPGARPKGSCDVYAAANTPCAAAHSTTRALYAAYNGPLYQVLRQSDGKTLDIGVVQPSGSGDSGGYADAAAQDKFCAHTYCWITTVYDQSPRHNDLTQAPRGGFSGPAMGGLNNLPVADMAPITIMGHKAYGVFIAPGMGLRINDVKGTAVDDQAEGQYWVINGRHFNAGCCFDYGNAEIDSRDDDNGTMETAYFGDATPWYHGTGVGAWIMTDQENNLVGCVNPDGSKLCPTLPKITWRFVTAMAKGEPHHWASLGGDAQQGKLAVMFDGPRINGTYDPMRKQGAILLGNGGDNSVGSQGTFYEGAMTAAGTFPSDAVDQEVQANVVAARYDVPRLTVAPAAAKNEPSGVQTFTPGSAQEVAVTFTNTTGSALTGVQLALQLPGKQWGAVAQGSADKVKTFSESVAPGASISATFKVTAGPAAYNGDLVANASWANAGGKKQLDVAALKVRSVSPVKINEVRISSGPPANSTDSFIELYNAGSGSVDVSNWTLTAHASQQAAFSAVKMPAGTRLPAGGFYLLGLANSGLAAPARSGDTTVFVRSTTGMKAGDTVIIDTESGSETRKITSLGTAAHNSTTVWQPLPDGQIVTMPAGATNVPVTSATGFAVGQKIALGYGATFPVVARTLERYEVATVTAVGKSGTQAYLAADATAGATNLKVTSVENLSAGDKIRLDIDSKDHGIETVTVKSVGSAASRTNFTADAGAGATKVKVRSVRGFSAGETLRIGTPANEETVTISTVGTPGPNGTGIYFAPALAKAHISTEGIVVPGSGLELTAPLRFNHADNLPFSNHGTGITFQPATAFAHTSDEPVQALGTGLTLDRPLGGAHAVDAAVRDAAVTTAGYQGSPAPQQWFGGPTLSTEVPLFERTITVSAGSLVLRDAGGLVVDSLNYGGLVDPWAAEGYQSASGPEERGCFVATPGLANGSPFFAANVAVNTSAGRFPDGADTDSNCTDFSISPATLLEAPASSGATNIKVAGVGGFSAGQTIRVGAGADAETAVIASVGTPGATTLRTATAAGATSLPVANAFGFSPGQTLTLGEGGAQETVMVAAVNGRGPAATVTVSKPLTNAHPEGSEVAGSGLTLAKELERQHAGSSPVTGDLATPGAANHYQKQAATGASGERSGG